MPHLVIHAEDGGMRRIDLHPGVNRIGRLEETEHTIPHTSVSGSHCEIVVGEDGVRIIDLGSTNGTFVDGEAVKEALLADGQKLTLGEVECDFCAGETPPVSATGGGLRLQRQEAPDPVPEQEQETHAEDAVDPFLAAQAQASGGPADCVNHPGVAAALICPRCSKLFCKECVEQVQSGMRHFQKCPECGAFCQDSAEVMKAAALKRATFAALLPGAFSYPFKDNGPMLLVCGTIFFALLEGAKNILGVFGLGLLGLAFWIAAIMSTGYLFAFMQNIILSTVNGDETMPRFPEMTDFTDTFVMPAIRVVVMSAVLCGPGILLMINVDPVAGIGVLLLGLVCYPMTILTVSLANGLGGLNPLIILSGIAKVPGAYSLVCLLFLVLVGVQGGFRLLLEEIGMPVLPTVVGTALSLYLITVEMRILGNLYLIHRERFAWFN